MVKHNRHVKNNVEIIIAVTFYHLKKIQLTVFRFCNMKHYYFVRSDLIIVVLLDSICLKVIGYCSRKYNKSTDEARTMVSYLLNFRTKRQKTA